MCTRNVGSILYSSYNKSNLVNNNDMIWMTSPRHHHTQYQKPLIRDEFQASIWTPPELESQICWLSTSFSANQHQSLFPRSFFNHSNIQSIILHLTKTVEWAIFVVIKLPRWVAFTFKDHVGCNNNGWWTSDAKPTTAIWANLEVKPD